MNNREPGKLLDALLAAGIPVDGCNAEGRIDFKSEATSAQRTQAQQIAANFDWNAPSADEQEGASLDAILSKADSDVTAAELKTVVLRALRRARRRKVI